MIPWQRSWAALTIMPVIGAKLLANVLSAPIEEVQTALDWLVRAGMASKVEDLYTLTDKGQAEFMARMGEQE